MRKEYIKVRNEPLYKRQKLYDFLISINEPISKGTRLLNKDQDYDAFHYAASSWGLIKGPSTISIDDFIAKYSPNPQPTDLYDRLTAPNTAIHCKTEDEANKLLKWAHDQGLRWMDGTSYLKDTYYYQLNELSCYHLNEGLYGSLKSAMSNREVTVIPFSSIPEFQETLQTTIKNLKPGTKVRVRPDLNINTEYNTNNNERKIRIHSYMEKLKGKIVTIKKVEDCTYRIKEKNEFYWTNDMFSEVIENQTSQPNKQTTKKETFMSKLKETALTTVDQNKEVAIIAAKMEAGRIINKQVIKQAAKHIPFWAKGYLETPLAPVVLANAVAMLGNHTGNTKVQKISELMLLAAADVTVQSFNLDKIIDDMLSGIKLPAGILDDNK